MTNTLGSPGVNLRGYLDERGTLDAALACRVGAQIASELAQAHANGVLHVGVQPETIRLDQPGYPPSARLTGRGATLAPQYLAIGATIGFTDLVVMAVYTAMASRVMASLKEPAHMRGLNRVMGSLFVAAGALLAFFKRAA